MNSDQEKPYCYSHPRPSVSVDCVVVGMINDELNVLLIERGRNPFKGLWALPGGFVDQDEDLDAAAARELKEETNVGSFPMHQLAAFGRPGRDPRTHVISVAYLIPVEAKDLKPVAGDDAVATKWCSLKELPNLAFDHNDIVVAAVKRLNELSELGQYPKALNT